MSLPKAEAWIDPGSMDAPPRRARRVLAGLAVFLIALVGSALVWRATSLHGLPDFGPPFDLVAHGVIAVPEAENAWTYYRAATALVRGGSISIGTYTSWAQVSRREKDWFDANRDALRVWLAGTTKDQAVFHPPREVRYETNLDAAQSLRSMLALARLAALRMESQGELEEAWTWYRSALRSTRHCGRNGTFIERLVGMAMYIRLAPAIRNWSDHPNLSLGTLRAAFDDLLAIDAMTAPLSENLRVEYFALAHLLDEPEIGPWMIEPYFNATGKSSPPTRAERFVERLRKLALREPERSRRALRLVWANWLSVADLPVAERNRRRRDYAVAPLFDPPPDAPRSARALSPDALDRWVESTRYLRLTLPALGSILKAEALESAARDALLLHLAERLYLREHGKPPESPRDLVGPYLRTLPETPAKE